MSNGVWTTFPLSYSSSYIAQNGSDIIRFDDKIFYTNQYDFLDYFYFDNSIPGWVNGQDITTYTVKPNSDFAAGRTHLFFINQHNNVCNVYAKNSNYLCYYLNSDAPKTLNNTGLFLLDDKVYYITENGLFGFMEYKIDMLSFDGDYKWLFSYVYPCAEEAMENSEFYVDNSRIVYVRERGVISNIYDGNISSEKVVDLGEFKSVEDFQLQQFSSGFESLVSISPNPNNGEFSILNNVGTDGTLNIYDISGNIIFIVDVYDGEKKTINLNFVDKGIYFGQFKLKDGLIIRKKIIVN